MTYPKRNLKTKVMNDAADEAHRRARRNAWLLALIAVGFYVAFIGSNALKSIVGG